MNEDKDGDNISIAISILPFFVDCQTKHQCGPFKHRILS